MSHIYFAMSHFKEPNFDSLTKPFYGQHTKYTAWTTSPNSVKLQMKDGVGSIMTDSYDEDEKNILCDLGIVLENKLTCSESQFQDMLKKSKNPIKAPEFSNAGFNYCQAGKLLIRSQIDCWDPRLPNKTFDLKTRATLPIRMDVQNYKMHLGYKLRTILGLMESFEREKYDLIRSALLKYW